ncbi:MAG: PIN domain-containing protein [Salinirussus sp.]
MRVVVDTNALMMPIEADVRLFDELDRLLGAAEVLVPAAVITELEQLAAAGAGEEARAASVGRDLAERCTPIETPETDADAAVLSAGLRETTDFVVTNDRDLRRQLLDAGVSVISLRGGHKLAITQP